MSKKVSHFANSIYWKFDFKKVNKFILSYLLSPLGGRNYKKFFILTRPRTGSNLLLDYLNSNKGILSRSEVFRNLCGKDHRKMLNKLFRRYPFYIKAVGFKVFYDHPLDSPRTSLWDDLAENESIKVIHLDRENILRSFVSQKIAEKTNIWLNKRSGKASDWKANEKNIQLNAEELEREFEKTRRWQHEGEERFKRHQVLQISYEDLTRNSDDTFIEVCNFLEVPFQKPRTTLKRQNPEKLGELIGNYQEMKDHFKNSEFACFFED